MKLNFTIPYCHYCKSLISPSGQIKGVAVTQKRAIWPRPDLPPKRACAKIFGSYPPALVVVNQRPLPAFHVLPVAINILLLDYRPRPYLGFTSFPNQFGSKVK